MIHTLVERAIEQRRVVLFAWALVATVFLFIAVNLKLDALPDITSNQVQILTRAPGLTPEEVEQRVTRPVEAALGGIPNVTSIRGLSRYGLSTLTVVFDDAIELLRARQLVAERLASVSIDKTFGVEPPQLGPMTGGLGEIFHFTVASASKTPAELLVLVQQRVAPILRTVPGVVEVNSWGGSLRTLEVRADPHKLQALNITFDELKHALTASVGSQPGAALEAGDSQVLLRGLALPKTEMELAESLVRVSGDKAIRVGDVAQVVSGSLPRLGAATQNGKGETIYVMVQMLIGANARDVTHAVRAKMSTVSAVLPSDTTIDIVYDRSSLVDATLKTVAKSLLEGGVLVCVVLYLMLGSVRAGFLVAMAIPISMLGATAAMTLGGVTGNLMSLGAVDFGLLVDGAVVLVEHMFHRRLHGNEPWKTLVKHACAEVARPSFFGVFVILLVYVPVLSLQGVDGKMFRPMALTVVLALVVALLFTLTFVPAAAATWLSDRHVPSKPPRLVRWVERVHTASLRWSMKRAKVGATITLLVVGIAGVAATRLGSELAPQLDEGSLVIQTTRAGDLGLGGAVRVATSMEQALLHSIPEVRSVASRLGSPAIATDVMGLEQADVFVELAPKSHWRRGLHRDQLLAQISAVVDAATPRSSPSLTQPIQMRFNELLGGAPFDVVVSVLGQDLEAITKQGSAVVAKLAAIRGVEEPRMLAEDVVPLLSVVPRALAAGQAGFTAQNVNEITGALRLGIDVGTSWEGLRQIPIVLRLGEAAPSAEALHTVRVPSTTSGLIPLGDIAAIAAKHVPAALYRYNGERRKLIGFNVRGRDLGEVVAEAQSAVARGIPAVEGVRLSWGGQFETLEEAKGRLRVLIPAVLILIGLVLFAHFRAHRPVLWVFAHVPFAAVGGIYALVIRGMALSISASIGFIALWGIAVMNGTVLVTEIQRLEQQGRSPAEATEIAAHSRARPVAMTALVAALGFLPMALATGVGSEVQRPLATVVIGGLVSSTVLTLLILPVFRIALARRQAS